MARLVRLICVGVAIVLASSGVLGSSGTGWLPGAMPAEASSVDWQPVFPNGDFEDGPYTPNSSPANYDFASGLTSWTVNTAPVTVGTSGPSGDYASIGEGGKVTSPAISLDFEDDGFQSISFDFGFLEASSITPEESNLLIYGVTANNDEIWLETVSELAEFLPSWGTYTTDIRQLIFEAGEEPLVALRFVADGVVGIDNVAVQNIQLPGWYWGADTAPTIQASGPEGKYVHQTAESGVYMEEYVSLPANTRNFAYWLRVSAAGAAQVEIGLRDDDEFEATFWDSIDSGDGEWTKRVVDLAACPEEDACQEIRLYVSAISGTVDFSLASVDDASDVDEDGIYDEWEEYGVLMPVLDGPGNFIDLPAMGSDPDKPDVFVHLDYMEDQTHNQRLADVALESVVDAFADSSYISPTSSEGIILHIDQGSDSTLNYQTEDEWNDLSRAGSFSFDQVLGSGSVGSYNWSEFEAIKQERFTPTGRAPIFHYAIAAYRIGSSSNNSSGISRINGVDFIVSLNDTTDSFAQAGTFMHELGHNLGLLHGGSELLNRKPNYLSVMNYSFQMIGLLVWSEFYQDYVFGKMDFSHAALPSLDEADLDEAAGLGSGAYGFGTLKYCGTNDNDIRVVGPAHLAIDWNCDSDATDDNLAFSVNKDQWADSLLGFDDWASVLLVGGGIGDDDEGSSVSEKTKRLRRMGEHFEMDPAKRPNIGSALKAVAPFGKVEKARIHSR